MPRLYVVIGLGRFGSGVAQTLVEDGQNVLGLDNDMHRVQEMSHCLPRVARCDATDIESLRVLGVQGCDTAVVAIGDSMEASILATLNLKQLGVRRVVAKAANAQHGTALERCGADRTVYPQRDMGVRVAHNLVAANVLDYVQLSASHCMVEMRTPRSMVGKTLKDLALPQRHGVSIVALRRDRRVHTLPRADEKLREGDILVLIGSEAGIRRVEESA